MAEEKKLPTPEETVAKAADKMEKKGDDSGVITLSTGVKLKVKPLPPMLLIEALTQFDRPKPPTFYDERLDRAIENPDDPDYKARVARYDMDYSLAVLNSMILFGTEIIEIPEGTEGPDGDEWIEKRKIVGISVLPESKSWRYLAWIKSVAVGDADDSTKITEVVGGASGVLEQDVERAAEAFRGDTAG